MIVVAVYLIGFLIAWPAITRKLAADWRGLGLPMDRHEAGVQVGFALMFAVIWPAALVAYVVAWVAPRLLAPVAALFGIRWDR